MGSNVSSVTRKLDPRWRKTRTTRQRLPGDISEPSSPSASNAAHGRVPHVLMQLELEADAVQARFQQPADQFDRLDRPEDATDEALEARVEPVFANDPFGP